MKSHDPWGVQIPLMYSSVNTARWEETSKVGAASHVDLSPCYGYISLKLYFRSSMGSHACSRFSCVFSCESWRVGSRVSIGVFSREGWRTRWHAPVLT